MNKKKRKTESNKTPYIFKTYINSFHYLYQDAEYLYNISIDKRMEGKFERVRLSRTALLLYIFSLEALINRAMNHLLSDEQRNFFMEREDKFTLQDKWLLLPLLIAQKEGSKFNRSQYPWSHFAELVNLRNDFVHPKHNRTAYYKTYSHNKFDPLDYNEIPKELGIKETNVVYRNIQIPKDPYSILPLHVTKAKKIIDDMITELDRLVDGRILKDNWLNNDTLELIYPQGKSLKDLNWNLNQQKDK